MHLGFGTARAARFAPAKAGRTTLAQERGEHVEYHAVE